MAVFRAVAGQHGAGSETSTFVVASPQMASLLALARRAGECDAPVLLTGESGVGKDLIAQYVHRHSNRRRRALVTVNCAALTDARSEAELFGAGRDTAGTLEAARGGTLFLDEIGEIGLRIQALLLRVLEHGDTQTLSGGTAAARADVRVVAATSRDLPAMVEAGHFRQDLLYCISTIHLDVPPLRERPEDTCALVRHFAERAPRPVRFDEHALQMLACYPWPGNVRELYHVIEQAAWVAGGDVVGVEHLPVAVRMNSTSSLPARERRRQVADELYNALVVQGCSFWEYVYPLFLSRDITRRDIRELVRRGLTATRGSYRALLALFGISSHDYKRFLNFLATHHCGADFRKFRKGTPDAPPRSPLVLPPPPSIVRETTTQTTASTRR